MYIAAVRMAHEFGCDLIGIQYQQGLKDMVPASDLAEGLLNNPDRPPVQSESGEPLYAGQALPHFNEVDECAGVDALITNRVWCALGLDPSTTLHDVRWGEHYSRRRNRRFRVGVSDLRRRPRLAPGGRLCGRRQRTPAVHVLPAGRRYVEGRFKPGELSGAGSSWKAARCTATSAAAPP